MALKHTEKMLVGAAMLAAGIAIVVGVGLPQFDAYNASTTELKNLNEEMTSLQGQKESLTAQIAILEKNTDIPPDIKIKTYTDKNREEVIKQVLDQIAGLATGAGNKFISLKPAEVDPLVAAAPVDEKAAAGTTNAPTTPPANGSTTEAPAESPPPMLNTFGYEMSVRGTYDTIQKFLKAMAGEKELMEISAINVTNETSIQGGATPDALADPSYPIKLTATLRLAMQQVAP
jgi:hypothetical protein